MIDYPYLIPECNVDTVFVEMLGYKRPNHAPSITQVSSILENKMTNRLAIGFIDNDKKQPQYFKQFKEIEKSNSVKLLKHPKRNHYLIVVHPAMDAFIFNLCGQLNINLAAYNFPRELKAFTSFTKKESIKNNLNFKNLLNTIKQRNHDSVNTIISWMEEYHQ